MLKNLPTLIVDRRATFNPKTNHVETVPTKRIIQRITAFYDDGRARTISGDVWHVLPTGGDPTGADYRINPQLEPITKR